MPWTRGLARDFFSGRTTLELEADADVSATGSRGDGERRRWRDCAGRREGPFLNVTTGAGASDMVGKCLSRIKLIWIEKMANG